MNPLLRLACAALSGLLFALPAAAGELDPKCSVEEPAMSWIELANKPGCHALVCQQGAHEWSGGCTDGLASGEGTLLFPPEGCVGEGSFVAGKQHGWWTVRSADGNIGEGPYVDGKRHGRWTFRYHEGTVSEGPMVANKRHGLWTVRNADGDVFTGPYVDGIQTGKWSARLADGTVAEGPAVDGKWHGLWTVRYPDGRCVVVRFSRGGLVTRYSSC